MARPSQNLPVPVKAAPAPVKFADTAPGKAAHHYWRNRAAYAPVTGAGVLFAAGCEAHRVTGAADALGIVSVAALAAGGHAAHRVWRKRNGRPLVNAHRLYQAALASSSITYLAAASSVSPTRPAMAIFYGVLTAPLALAWWLRRLVPDAPQAPVGAETQAAPAEPPATQDDPRDAFTRLIATVWEEGFACEGGQFPRTGLDEIERLSDTGGFAFAATVRFNRGKGPVRHRPAALIEHTDLIAQAYTGVGDGGAPIHPANVIAQPRPDGTARLYVFERNPLQAAAPLERVAAPGSFTHPQLARTVTGEYQPYRVWVDGFGSPHRVAVGSTGSGKSQLARTLLTLDMHTTDEHGRPVVAPLVLDPHAGASYAGWLDKVDLFARPLPIEDLYVQIRLALEAMVQVLRVRVGEMAAEGIDLIRPTHDRPLVSGYIDEVPTLMRRDKKILPLLEELAEGGRKAAMRLTVMSISVAEDVLTSHTLRDALVSGDKFLLRGGSLATKLNLAPGVAGVDPRGLQAHFADGSPTGGLGYRASGGDEAGQPVRFAQSGARWLATGRSAHIPQAAELRERFALQLRESASPGAASAQAGGARAAEPADAAHARVVPIAAGSRPARGETWPRVEQFLDFTGEPQRVRDIAAAVGGSDTAVINALQRNGAVQDPDTGRWTLEKYLTAGVLDGVAA